MDLTPSKRKRCSMGPEASLAFSLQALFERHEAYAADAERERTRLELELEKLEGVNQQLEDNNTQLKKENQNLHNKLARTHRDQGLVDGNTYGSSNPLETIRRLEDQIEELRKKQASLQAALNKALDQERIVVKDWMDTKIEVNGLRKQLQRGVGSSSLLEIDVPSRSSSQSSIDNAYFSSRNPSSSTSTSIDDSIIQSALSKQHNVLHLLQSQVEDLRNQLLTEQNLAIINHQSHIPTTVSSPTQELTFDLSSNQPQEVHVHHHNHASTELPPRPQSLFRSKTQAVKTKKRPMLSIERSLSTRLSKRSSLQAIPDDPMLEQAAAIQSALILPAFSRGFRSRQSSNNSTPRPQRLASGYSYKSSHGSSPQSVQSTVLEDGWRTRMEDDQSRPTTPGSSIIWTPTACEEDAEDVTTLCSKVDSPVMLPYDVSEEGDYFPSADTPVIVRAPVLAKKQPTTFGASSDPSLPATRSNADQNQPLRELPTSLQVPRQRPLRSVASLALLRPCITTASTSERPQPPRRLQSLPSTQSAPSLLTPSTSLTITTVNAAATLTSSTTSYSSVLQDNESSAKHSRIGGWLPKWRHTSNNEIAASKLQAILHEDVTKQASIDQPQSYNNISNASEPRNDPSMLRDITWNTPKPNSVPVLSKPQSRAAGVNQPGGLALFLQQARDQAQAQTQAQQQPPIRSISAPAFPSIASSPTRSIRSTRLEDSELDEDALAECLAEARSIRSLSPARTHSNLLSESDEDDNLCTDLTFFPRVQGDADWASFMSIASTSNSATPGPSPPSSRPRQETHKAVLPLPSPSTAGPGMGKKNACDAKKELVVRNRSLKKSGWRSVSGGALGR